MSQDVDFEQLSPDASATRSAGTDGLSDLRRLSAVPVDLSVEIGRARMSVGETLELREGSVVTLDRMAGEPVDLLVNGIAIARGEVVVIDEQFGLRLTQVLTSAAGAAATGMATGGPLAHADVVSVPGGAESVPDGASADDAADEAAVDGTAVDAAVTQPVAG